MKVRAVYNFYLDFILPRLENGEGIGIHTTIDGCDAWAATWGAGDPLFPSEPDVTLSSYAIDLHPVTRPEISIRRDARSRILDRISVVLEWEQSAAPVEDKSVTGAYLERAVLLANAVLEHIRVSCGLVDIGKISRSWDPAKSEISITVPHTQSWFDAEADAGLNVFMGKNSLGSSEGIRIGPIPVTSTSQLMTTLAGEGPPPLHLSLLMDAEGALLTLSLREATLSIASACEVRANSYIETQSVISRTSARRILGTPSVSFATKHYDLLPQSICSRSLRIDNAGAFELIDEAYSERNRLIHTGRFSHTFSQMKELDKLRRADEWLASARVAIKWMDSLPS